MTVKRPSSTDAESVKDSKKSKISVVDAKSATSIDDYTPLQKLKDAMKSAGKLQEGGKSVLHWMRNKDFRLKDNRALSCASASAKSQGLPLIVLHLFSPEDYSRHDRSPRRVDFMIRNLRLLQGDLADLNIPLYTETVEKRNTIPQLVVDLAEKWGAIQVWGNIEYEIDELRRDAACIKAGEPKKVKFDFVADYLLVQPGEVLTKSTSKTPVVFSPFLRTWTTYVENNLDVLDLNDDASANDKSVKSGDLKDLFNCKIPTSIKGYELQKEDADKMLELWPEGHDKAVNVLERFVHTRARHDQIDKDPLRSGADENDNQSRLSKYDSERSNVDSDSSSRMSPYLAAGVISVREVLQIARQGGKMDTSRNSGLGIWTQEIAWRDFYGHILAAFPRVCMGRPFQEKFKDVVWETDEEMLAAWKSGMTGYPLVDAAMRQCNLQGWMHNRTRMVAGMFLVKDMMQDWRLGEQYFMSKFIDGDFASNNGGWQWVASTGTDAQPYFRLMNPTTQSEKADVTGTYIKTYVPELRGLSGAALHDPHGHLSEKEFSKLGYPKPVVEHKMARERALFRYKYPGQKEGDQPQDEDDGKVEKSVKSNAGKGAKKTDVKGTAKDHDKDQRRVSDMFKKKD